MRVEQDPVRNVPPALEEALLERAALGEPRIRYPHAWRHRLWAELSTIRRLFARTARR